MALPLPLPLKVAAGLVVTGVERIRSLPTDLTALPVQAAGYALRLSMKVQQEIAELATKGDETLGAVFGGAQPERSPLATFDDDLPTPTRPVARATRPSGPVGGTRRPAGRVADSADAGRSARRGVPPTVPVVPPGATIDGLPVPGAEPVESTGPSATPDGAARAAEAPAGAATGAAGLIIDDEVTTDPVTGDEAAPRPESVVPADWSVTREDPLADASRRPAGDAVAEPALAVVEEPDPVVWTTTTDEPIAGPPTIVVPLPLPDYDELTVAQVRGHLRRLTADDVQALLEHEQRNGGRAPFLTLLSNRLVTLQHSS